ncbi:MAG: hemerythrin domain-containing protein [Deltaproteobacteria bacterium]|nr:hemerythrin domain-containing protein [Deltaproteobacteria bacterium]
MSEHRLIERALDALERWVTTLGSGSESDDKAELTRFVSFIRDFGDAYHHSKEEDMLFVAMVDQGFPREAGPIAMMLHEHELGRSLVSVLDGLAQQSTAWSKEDSDTLASTAREFSALLRQHIQKDTSKRKTRSSTPWPTLDCQSRSKKSCSDDSKLSKSSRPALASTNDSAHSATP